MTDEIQPFVVYRIEGEQMECALWQFKEGPKALALFLSENSAANYRESALQGIGWQAFCPTRTVLLQMLTSCRQAGIEYAVLDPDVEKAKRIFNIQEILKRVVE